MDEKLAEAYRNETLAGRKILADMQYSGIVDETLFYHYETSTQEDPKLYAVELAYIHARALSEDAEISYARVERAAQETDAAYAHWCHVSRMGTERDTEAVMRASERYQLAHAAWSEAVRVHGVGAPIERGKQAIFLVGMTGG